MFRALLNAGLIIGILIFVNVIGSYFYNHLDLTEDKRFTLTKATKNLLADVDDPVLVRVLLEGEFPAGFKRLQNATKDILDDFRSESGNIEYIFEDPNIGTVEQINERRKILSEQGVRPVNLRLKDKEGTSEKLIYPFAMLSYKNKSIPINLLEPEIPGMSPERILNNSISLLEYKIANAIDKLDRTYKQPLVAFVEGHGELGPLQTQDIETVIAPFYDSGRINLDSVYSLSPEKVAILVIAKPIIAFSERDKFIIDQFVMRGGKVMWLIDKLNVNLDSLQRKEFYVPYDLPLNLDDQFFKYGFRIQPNLVLDLQCTRIPQVIGQQSNNPQIEMFPYFYHPVIVPRSSHPIVKSLEGINLYYPSTIDTVQTKTNVEKTILLESSEFTRMQYSPVRLDFKHLRYEAKPEKFDKKFQPVGILLEGEFPSLYEGRATEKMKEGLAQLGLDPIYKSSPTKMLVVSDGDVIKNLVDPSRNAYQPLGFNPYEKYKFANREFILNAIEYLAADGGVITARSKDVKLRLLNTVKAEAEKTKWQLINIIFPLVFLGLFGFAYNFIRKKRYNI